MVWTIEAKVLPLMGISGHLYLDIFDDSGARVCQINGLATNPRTLQPRSVGLPGDLLQAYVGDFTLVSTIVENETATRDHHPHRGRVLFQGNEQDIMKAIEAAKKEAVRINKLHLPYRLLSLNSNSVFMKMVAAISAVLPLDQEAVKETLALKQFLPGINGKITDDFHGAARKDIAQSQPARQFSGLTP